MVTGWLPGEVEGHLSAGAFPGIHQEGAVGQAHSYARHITLQRGRPRGCAQPRHRQTCQPCRQASFSDALQSYILWDQRKSMSLQHWRWSQPCCEAPVYMQTAFTHHPNFLTMSTSALKSIVVDGKWCSGVVQELEVENIIW